MGGFLKRLDRKNQRSGPKLAEDLVRLSSDAPAQGTQIYSSKLDMGAPQSLLKDDGGAVTQNSSTAGDSNDAVTSVPIVDKAVDGSKASTGLLDEAVPWWINNPQGTSPQLDVLVPVARQALNELITEEIKREDLPNLIRQAVGVAINRLASEVRFSGKEVQDAVHELCSLLLGKGPLQSLYDDPLVTDIYLDRHDSIKCVRRGQALETPFRFRSAAEAEAYITSMLQGVDRVLNMSSPIVDCVLNDQWRSRVNAVHASLLDGKESSLVIRVPRLQQISFYDLLRTKTLPATLAAWLAEVVASGEANILVIGPTGSGKTTMTTALLTGVGSDERIVTIEDVPEIFVPTSHLEKLVSRPDNAQGEGAVGMEKLLRAALRRAPHRIVVGEIRDREGPLFLKALETGHAGSIATIHADNPRDGLWRLLDVVAAFENAPMESLQRRIGRSLHLLVAMKKINGRPCLTEIAEVLPPISGEFIIRTLVSYDGERGGKRQWRVATTQSEWLERMAKRGVELLTGPGLLPAVEQPTTSDKA